jgi:hypothetical protein
VHDLQDAVRFRGHIWQVVGDGTKRESERLPHAGDEPASWTNA